jgi:hypothetical protein
VSAAFMGDDGEGGVCPAGFAIEALNRTSGIRVIAGAAVSPGQSVLVRGTTATDQGERVIEASSVTPAGSGQAAKPFHIANKSAGGGASGAQAAVVDNAATVPPRVSVGTNNVGLLMKISGRVTKVTNTGDYSGFFYLDDGSSLRDGAGWIGIKCRPPSNPPVPSNLPQQGDYVVVNGVMGVRQVSGHNARYFWTVTLQVLSGAGR